MRSLAARVLKGVRPIWKVMRWDITFRIQVLMGCSEKPESSLIERWQWAVWDTDFLSRVDESYTVWASVGRPCPEYRYRIRHK